MSKILPPSFFNRPTLKVARELLGKYLVRKIGKKIIVGMITEVEAYDGPHDLASHASKGLTERTKVMFGPAGHWYVYLVYGMYWMLNIVTREKGYPAAILIRSINVNFDTKKHSNILQNVGMLSGPGKITKYFKIDKNFNGIKTNKKTGLWIEDRGVKVSKKKIIKSERVGVDYAGPVWSQKKLRFYIDVSRFNLPRGRTSREVQPPQEVEPPEH